MGVGGEVQSVIGEANGTLQVPVAGSAGDLLLGPLTHPQANRWQGSALGDFASPVPCLWFLLNQ